MTTVTATGLPDGGGTILSAFPRRNRPPLEQAPERLALASEGHADALKEVEDIMISRTASNPRAGIQRPSMAQDMRKGRRTEIEFMNGYIVKKGKDIGIATPANEKIVDIVLRVASGKLKPSPDNLNG